MAEKPSQVILIAGLSLSQQHDYRTKLNFDDLMKSFADLPEQEPICDLPRLKKERDDAQSSRDQLDATRDRLRNQIDAVQQRSDELNRESEAFSQEFQTVTEPAQSQIAAEHAAIAILHSEILEMVRAAIQDRGRDGDFSDLPEPDLSTVEEANGIAALLVWAQSVGHRIASLQSDVK
jgi:methyl-accepting chemotaxis protein